MSSDPAEPSPSSSTRPSKVPRPSNAPPPSKTQPPSETPPPEPPEGAGSAPPPESAVKFTRAGALWTALIAGFVILILLLVFILQNTTSAEFAFLGWQWSLPLGVAILFAAVCGGLVTVAAGTARIYQLRRAAKKNLRSR
jgi:uncharacterized integral membrane protein